jgi:hypothetical protein
MGLEKGWKNVQVCALLNRYPISHTSSVVRRSHTLYHESGLQLEGSEHYCFLLSRSHHKNVVTQIRKRQLCHGGSYKGINYYPGADKPYLVTTGEDKTVKIWVYLSKSYQRLFHPDLPIDISGSEGGTVSKFGIAAFTESKIHSTTPSSGLGVLSSQGRK